MAPPGPRPSVRRCGEGRAGRLSLGTLESIPGLAHAFSLRDSTPQEVLRDVMHAEIPLLLLRQVHGASVKMARRMDWAQDPGAPPPEGDALVTAESSLAIGVLVADCAPILVCDPVRRGIAAVHAGWRGTAAGVLTVTIETMCSNLGSNASDLHLAIGPAIGPCCFEVGDEVVDALLQRDPGATECVRLDGRRRLVDLIEANRRQALDSGVPSAQIASADLCTVCNADMFWSYRRDRSAAGRMVAFVGWSD